MNEMRVKSSIEKKMARRANFDGICEGVSSVCWNKELSRLEVDDCYLKFLNSYSSLCESLIPEKRLKKSFGEQWMTYETRKSIKSKHQAWYRLKSCKKDLKSEIKKNYKLTCSEFKKVLTGAKLKYENTLAGKAKKDPKLVYEYIRSKMGVKDQIRAMRKKMGL